jgi:ATP-binding protein involved in chromosome partitioning
MKIAMPVQSGKLSQHFGHSEQFSLFDIEDQSVRGREDVTPPPHEPGLLPRWLKENGVTLVIAGGMGHRAQTIFEQAGIQVICGAPSETPDSVVERYLKGELETGDNTCDH